ncbi:MAG: deoxyribose-phosphate aldolase [Blastochloris sp.]|nr:deoxyribose-phosphate aldolase [Blastochloris sp.]
MNLAQTIDHTLLKPEATLTEIEKLCAEAREHNFFSVCLNPYWISNARALLQGSSVKICTVVGFPLGATLPQAKAHATQDVVAAGADEIDMVMNIGAAREGHWNFIEHEIHDVVSQAKGRTVKVILEICLLSPEQIVAACQACERGGASFVKTSTGFSQGGATLEAVRLMRQSVSPQVGVKASGGIRSREDALAMIEAGATRLGTSASIAILQGRNGTDTY